MQQAIAYACIILCIYSPHSVFATSVYSDIAASLDLDSVESLSYILKTILPKIDPKLGPHADTFDSCMVQLPEVISQFIPQTIRGDDWKKIVQKACLGAATGILITQPESAHLLSKFLTEVSELSPQVFTKSYAPASTFGKKFLKGAKAGFVGGAIIELMSLGYNFYTTRKAYKNGEISQEQYRKHMMQRTGAAVTSLGFTTLGSAIGTVVIPVPVVGTFIGGFIGGVVGDYVGSVIGDAVDNKLFG